MATKPKKTVSGKYLPKKFVKELDKAATLEIVKMEGEGRDIEDLFLYWTGFHDALDFLCVDTLNGFTPCGISIDVFFRTKANLALEAIKAMFAKDGKADE